MTYLKNYIVTHLKFWWLYMVAILSSSFGLLFAVLVIGRQADAWGVAPGINLLASSLVAAAIGSLPIIYANNMAAKRSGGNMILKTIINHLLTVVVFYAIMYYILNSLINFS